MMGDDYDCYYAWQGDAIELHRPVIRGAETKPVEMPVISAIPSFTVHSHVIGRGHRMMMHLHLIHRPRRRCCVLGYGRGNAQMPEDASAVGLSWVASSALRLGVGSKRGRDKGLRRSPGPDRRRILAKGGALVDETGQVLRTIS